MGSIRNITSSDVDVTGRQLVRSNNIRAVAYYNSKDESWLRDYSGVQPVVDPYFDVVISGTSPWSAAHSEDVPGSYVLSTSRSLFAGEHDIIRQNTASISRSSVYGVQEQASALVRWPSGGDSSYYAINTWASTGSSGWVRFDLGADRTFNTLMFDWAGMTGRTNSFWFPPTTPVVGVRGWHLDISNDDLVYTTLVSGEAFYGQLQPVNVDFSDVSARYVKLYLDSNWGGPCVGVEEFCVFNRADASKSAAILWGADYITSVRESYGAVRQFVDVSGIDRLFFDFGGNTMYTPSSSDSVVRLVVDGDVKFDSAVTQESNSTQTIFNSWSYFGYSVDVSGYSGAIPVELRFTGHYSPHTEMNRADGYAWVSRVSSWPTWFDEAPSETRGDSRAFPDIAAVVVDDSGVSILDISKYDSSGVAQPVLWMRWDCRITYSPFSFSSVYAEGGRVYLGGSGGLVVLDFVEDAIEWYGPSGHQRFTGIAHREDAIYDTSFGRTGVHPSWRTISTAAAHTLPVGVSCLSGVSGIPGGAVLCGTTQGAVSLVSGTLYQSAYKYPVSSVDATSGVAFVGLDYGAASASACVFRSSTLGTSEFEYDSMFSFSDVVPYSVQQAKSVVSPGFSTTYSGSAVTISGTPTSLDRDGQRAALYFDTHSGPSPMVITADVRIREWPEDCPGEVRLGLVEGFGVDSIKAFASVGAGAYLAASNRFSVPVYSDDFSDYNVEEDNYYMRGHGQSFFPYYTPYEDSRGMIFSPGYATEFSRTYSKYELGARNCIVRFKIRPYRYSGAFYMSCSITDYTLSDSAGNGLQFSAYTGATPYYGIRSYGSPTSSYSTVPFFGDEGLAEESEYHEVYLHYEYALKKLTACIDGLFIGSAQLSTLTANYITFTSPNSFDSASAIFAIKDFSVDFYDDDHSANTKQYIVGRRSGAERSPEGSQYIWGSPNNPYKSDIVVPFFGDEGTEAEGYRRWSFLYDPIGSSYSCYVGGTFVGAGSLSTPLISPGVVLDAQFFPATTASGSGTVVVDIDNLTVSTEQRSMLGLPFSSFPGQVPNTGAATAVAASSYPASATPAPNRAQEDVTAVVGSSSGCSVTSFGLPNFNIGSQEEKFTFSSGAVPSSWYTVDMPGSSGASSWAVSSGTLKQTGSVGGHGASIAPSDKIRGPFGSHLVTDVPTGALVGSYTTVALRTTSTGTYGLGLNTVYNQSGAETVASGSYIVFGQSEVRMGDFSSYYNSDSSTYSAQHTVTYSGTGLLDHKTGVVRYVGALTTTSGVDVYVDGVYKHSLPSGYTTTSGLLSIISNGNAFSEARFVGNIRPEIFSYAQSTSSLAPQLHGDSQKVSSAYTLGSVYRSSGVAALGTSASGEDSAWIKHPQVLGTTGGPYLFRSAVCDDELDRVYITMFNYTSSAYDYSFRPGIGWEAPTTTISLARNAADASDTSYDGPWVGNGSPGVLAVTPRPHHFIYVLTNTARMGAVDLSNGDVVRWGAEATNQYSADMPMNIANRPSTYYQPFSNTTGDGTAAGIAPKAGTPVFHWGLGAAIFVSAFSGFCKFALIYPDKGHAWSYGPTGETSYSLSDTSVPPFLTVGAGSWPSAVSFAYSAATDSVYYFNSYGVYVLRNRTNSWAYLEALPDEVVVGQISRSIVCAPAESLGKIYVHYSPYNAVHVFDTLAEKWSAGIDGLPFESGPEMNAMAFSESDSSLYFVPSSQPTNLYVKKIKPAYPGVLFSVQKEPGVLPDESQLGRFIWQGPDSIVASSDALYPSVDMDNTRWKSSASGTIYPSPFDSDGYVGVGDGCVRVHSKSVNFGSRRASVGGLSSRVAIPACSFSASLDVRVTELDSHSGARNHYCLFGISAGAMAPGYSRPGTTGLVGFTEPGKTVGAVGYNGLYMAAASHADYGEQRYMVLKRDGSSWSDTSTTQYSPFAGSDGTWGAEFKRWGISYDYPTRTLTATLSGEVVGSLTLSGRMDKMLLEIGAGGPAFINESLATNHTLEFKNFVSDFNAGVAPVSASSAVLTIDKNVYDNGSYSYKRILPTVSSGTDFVYEAEVACGSYSVSSSPYVFSIGKVCDGHRTINLCAIDYNGSRRLGFWSGLDPWTTISGFPTTVEHDWQIGTTYKLVRSADTVSVYADGIELSELSTDYSWFPRTRSWYDRSIAFGVDELPSGFVSAISCSLDQHAAGPVTVSGSWVRTDTNTSTPAAQASWFGGRMYHLTSPGATDEALTVVLPDYVNDTVYLYYEPSGGVYGSDATDVPVTIYAEAVFELPSPDSYASNNINSVAESTNHLGNVDYSATTVLVNHQKTADGQGQTGCHHGLVFLGKFFRPSHIVVTPDANGTVVVGSIFVYDFSPEKRLRNKSRTMWKRVQFEPGTTELTVLPECGVSFIDVGSKTLIDYYSDRELPGLSDGDVNDTAEG